MASGFVSSGSVNAKESDKEWQAAYERLQKEPLEAKEKEEQDNRPLAEQLHERKAQKDAEFEEKTKFSNQFRGLEAGEAAYLNEMNAKRNSESKRRREEEEEELMQFKQARATTSTPPTTTATPAQSKSVPKPPTQKSRKVKGSLKGVVKKL